MTLLLDTQFLVWIMRGSRHLASFPWLERYRPWGVSPTSLVELQFLAEVGRAGVVQPAFTETALRDPRFIVDDPGFLALSMKAISVSWTRDPFDRLLVAHSLLRAMPLCTMDRRIRKHHGLLPPELASV